MKHSRNRTALAHVLAYWALAGCGGGGENAADAPVAQSSGERAQALALAASFVSVNGSKLTLWSGGSLIDTAGNVWRINGPGTSVGPGVTVNGVYSGHGAALLTIFDGLIWAQHLLGDWYTLVAPGIATPQATGPALAPAPAPAPAPEIGRAHV